MYSPFRSFHFLSCFLAFVFFVFFLLDFSLVLLWVCFLVLLCLSCETFSLWLRACLGLVFGQDYSTQPFFETTEIAVTSI